MKELKDGKKISAKIIAWSKCEHGNDLVTMLLNYPKFLDAEIEKHGRFETNASSDRAIPFYKTLNNDIYLPDDIRLNERGMQGYTSVSGEIKEEYHASLNKLKDFISEEFMQYSEIIHKQTLNRVMIGLSWQYKVITGTYDSYVAMFNLRHTPQSDPSIFELASRMTEQMNIYPDFLKNKLKKGDWHAPFTDFGVVRGVNHSNPLLKQSVARIARTSFKTQDGEETSLGADIRLHDRLLKDGHVSAFGGVATPLYHESMATHTMRDGTLCSGRFAGWQQLRKRVFEND